MTNDKLGVFICDCGDKVAGILDIEALIESAETLPGVVWVGHAAYWCSPDGRERLQATIRAQELERVVVAGCSPRTHQGLFQETAAEAGLNPNLLGLVNIREGCAWPHRAERGTGTTRACDQIGMEVVHTTALSPRPPRQAEITPAALIIGGGMAGMTAALELANGGISVTLVERRVALGGRAISRDLEQMAELIATVQAHPEVDLLLNSHITRIDGAVGSYYVTMTPPEAGEGYGPFGAIIVATDTPDEETDELAGLLRLPQDANGFLPEWRVRLRPHQYIERGIYVCGPAHYPCDLDEAQFQAYSVASRALRHLRQGNVTASGSIAQVGPEKCNGCGDCFKVCPFSAVTMVERSDRQRQCLETVEGYSLSSVEALGLSFIDPLLCTGCGNCVSICPVGAVTVPGWTDTALEAQIRVALSGEPDWSGGGQSTPRVLIFACEWSGYAAAELAGAQKLTYPANVRLIRLDCSGRLQPGLVLKAFEMGAAGVLVLGCPPKLCHYERGNERTAEAYEQLDTLTGLLGLPRSLLKLAWIPPDDGLAFAKLVTEFMGRVEETTEVAV
jgi:heterodisulfide reductase subunit A-like polyferredoxin/coenzyme F420-reducing hydrogenase delta subunit